MPTLTITRGLPASGKTTWAKQRLATDALRAARVNRDDMRRVMHGGLIGANWAERQVTLAQRAAVEALLRGGVDVFCDDTNLRARVVREFAELAALCGAGIRRRGLHRRCRLRSASNATRARPEGERVGEDVIRAMWQRYLAGHPLPLALPQLPRRCRPARGRDDAVYRPGGGLPEAVLVDIDGTVALMGGRSPYDMTRVGEDRPNPSVITAVRAMHAFGHHIVFCSGRSDDAREDHGAMARRACPGAVRGALHAGDRRLAEGLDRQGRDLRAGDPPPLPRDRRLRRPCSGGADVAVARSDRLPGRRRKLLARWRPGRWRWPSALLEALLSAHVAEIAVANERPRPQMLLPPVRDHPGTARDSVEMSRKSAVGVVATAVERAVLRLRRRVVGVADQQSVAHRGDVGRPWRVVGGMRWRHVTS